MWRKALDEAFRLWGKMKEKPIRSIVDRYGKKKAVCKGSYDVSRSSAETVCASMISFACMSQMIVHVLKIR